MTLSAGAPRCIISGFRDPWAYLLLVEDQQPSFNFVTTEGKNAGVFILNISLDGKSSAANTFGKGVLLQKGLMAIDGVPQYTDERLNFAYYGQGQYAFMVIGLV